MFQLAERKPFFIKVPVALMDGIIGFLDFLVRIFPGLEVRLTLLAVCYISHEPRVVKGFVMA